MLGATQIFSEVAASNLSRMVVAVGCRVHSDAPVSLDARMSIHFAYSGGRDRVTKPRAGESTSFDLSTGSARTWRERRKRRAPSKPRWS